MCTERKATGEYVLACFMFATMGYSEYSLTDYGKLSKNSNTYLSGWIIKAGINHKTLVRIANREDPDRTASSEAV